MAHVEKFKSSGVSPMVGHYAREAEARGYERDNIDGSRTHLNYEIAGSGSEPLAARVRDRVRDAMAEHERAAGKAVRKDANVMFDWVVTLPKDCPPDRAGEFFAATVDFIRNRYGAENVPGGFVHMDEATPHVHVPVVPVRGGKLQASKVVNRADLKTFHKALGAAVDAALGFHVSIELDESQKGAKQLSALSQDEYKAAKDELAATKAEVARLSDEAAELGATCDQLERDRYELEGECASAADRLEGLQQAQGAAEGEIEELERAIAAKAAQQRAAGAGIEPARVFEVAGQAARRADGLDGECQAAIGGALKGKGVPDCASSRARAQSARAAIERLRPVLAAARERFERCKAVFVGLARRVMSWGIFSRENQPLAREVAPQPHVPSLSERLAEAADAAEYLNRERRASRGISRGIDR